MGKKRPIAAVYRGEVACEGCAESVAKLLRKSPSNYKVHYLGPNEKQDINSETLSKLDLFAWPGGGDDEDADYLKVAHYTTDIQNYVKGGRKYAGFCMGAFLAGAKNHAFFGLMPDGSYVSGERFQPGAQVQDTNDTIILTDWTFHSGKKRGTTEKGRWQYFQDGGFIHLGLDTPKETLTLGHYAWVQEHSVKCCAHTYVCRSYTNDICAAILPYGKGHVGLIGVHPEADASWYEDWRGSNPQNITFDIGHDFVETLSNASEIAEVVN